MKEPLLKNLSWGQHKMVWQKVPSSGPATGQIKFGFLEARNAIPCQENVTGSWLS